MRLVYPGIFVAILVAAFSAHAQSLPVLAQPFKEQVLAPGGDAKTIDVRNYFAVPGVASAQFAVVDTVMGKFSLELLQSDAPIAVSNFLTYILSGRYQNTIIHRSVPGFVIQGGGYTNSVPTTHIQALSPIQNEFKQPNVRGTVAMAKLGGDPNSATSEWFVNLADNRENLDNQNGGFTVFARVMGTGMTVVDAIAALPRFGIGLDAPGEAASTPLRNVPSGETTLRAEYYVTVNSIRAASLFPTGGNASVIELSVQNSAPGVVTTLLSGTTLTLTPVGAGSATITVRATDLNGNTADGSFTVTVPGSTPTYSAQPKSQTVAAGSTVVLTAPSASAASYVWKRDGVEVPGAVTSTLVLKNVTSAQAGTYIAYATNSLGVTNSSPAVVTVVNTANPGRLINLSILTPLAAGDTMTMGTVLGGAGTSGSKPLLARAAGPSLAPLGVGDFLPDPTMTLINTSTSATVASNNDWGGTAALSDAFQQAGAFAYTSPTSKDAAIFQQQLAPSNYTVQVKDNGSGSGTVIAELYDSSGAAYTTSTPRLVNVSVLKSIAAGSTLTAGFVVGGSTSKTVLIRAVGPTLSSAPFNISGVMADPQLKLFDSTQAVIASNDDWAGSLEIMSAAEAVGAFRLSSATSSDAVILTSLPPGNYSAQVSGVNNTGGTAIVEVYEVP